MRGPNARARSSRQQRVGRSGGQRRGKEQGVEVGGERGQGEVAHVSTVYRIVKRPRRIRHPRPHIPWFPSFVA